MKRAEMAANDEAIVQYQKALCVHRYNIYKEIWEAGTGEALVCMAEPRNSHDRNTVAVEKDRKVIQHLQQSVAIVHSFSEERWKCSLHCDYYGMLKFSWFCITTKFNPSQKFTRLQYFQLFSRYFLVPVQAP